MSETSRLSHKTIDISEHQSHASTLNSIDDGPSLIPMTSRIALRRYSVLPRLVEQRGFPTTTATTPVGPKRHTTNYALHIARRQAEMYQDFASRIDPFKTLLGSAADSLRLSPGPPRRESPIVSAFMANKIAAAQEQLAAPDESRPASGSELTTVGVFCPSYAPLNPLEPAAWQAKNFGGYLERTAKPRYLP